MRSRKPGHHRTAVGNLSFPATLAADFENAFVLAATRRLIRPADAPPLGTIRSLAYFLPVIEEVLEVHVSPNHFDYLRHKLAQIMPTG